MKRQSFTIILVLTFMVLQTVICRAVDQKTLGNDIRVMRDAQTGDSNRCVMPIAESAEVGPIAESAEVEPIAIDRLPLNQPVLSSLFLPAHFRGGTVTWTDEDWDGSYGGIASSFAVSADGARIYVGWELNDERVSAYDATGAGTPIWEYDLRENGAFNIDGGVQVMVSADGQVLAVAVSGRNSVEDNTQESIVLGLNIATGEETWRYTTPLTIQSPDKGEWIGPVEMSANGSRIAVVSYGYRQDPVYEPIFITILDRDGSELHRIELTDPDNTIMYVNDVRLTGDGQMLAADFRMNSNPTHAVTVWDLSDYSEYASWSVMNSPPQGQLGFSADGAVLAIGDLRGKLYVYAREDVDDRGDYVLLWSYTIPPDHYYPWIVGLDVSPDGSKVAIGSYQSNETEVNAYLYLFDVQIGASSKIQSSNFGGTVGTVRFSGDGSVVAGAGYGPYPETLPGNDLVAINCHTGEETYRMAGATPGSLMGCALNGDGTRLAAGGKRVHAYQMGSGGLAYSIDLDMEPEPSPTPAGTATPEPTPETTPTPEPTATPEPACDTLGCVIDLPQSIFHSGDVFYCNVIICNPTEETYASIPVFMILDVYGMLFFAPEFNDFSHYTEDIVPGETMLEILPPFNWPENAGSASGILWYAGMTDSAYTMLFGEIDIEEFSWQ